MARAATARQLQVVRGGRAPKQTVPRSTQLREMKPEWVMCRVWMSNHSIDPQKYHLESNGWGGRSLVFTCPVCGTEIVKPRDRHGFRVGNTYYRHPDGYLMQEGGTLSAAEKATLARKF